MTDYIIRRAGHGDIDKIVDFNVAMARETEDKQLAQAIVTAGVTALLDRPDAGFYLVADVDGQAVGTLMITFEWSDWRNGFFWWIQSVYVVPEHRRQGVFRRLYEYVQALAARDDTGVCGLRLYVEQQNTAAQRTYQELGMAETKYRMYEIEHDDGS